GANAVPVVIPIGIGPLFQGIIDLVDMHAVFFDDTPQGTVLREAQIPAELVETARQAQMLMIERIIEQDDHLMGKFINGETPERAEVVRAMRKATIAGKIIPVMCGAGFKNKGVRPLLDAIVDYLPSPVDLPPAIGTHSETEQEIIRNPSDDAPLAALAFKIQADKHMGKLTYVRVYSGILRSGEVVYNSTRDKTQRIGRLFEVHANKQQVVEELRTGDVGAAVGLSDTLTGDTLCQPEHPIVLESIEFPAPVIGVAVKPATREDQDRLSRSLARIADEDPTFVVKANAETGEVIISGMGELHLDVILDRLRRDFNVGVISGTPQVAYRETILATIEHVHKHIKQTGGHGQYAHICFRIEPGTPGSGFQFENEVVGGRVPREYIPAVERGIVDAMAEGPYAGFQMVDIKVTLFDGSAHDVDSSDRAFRTCAFDGFRAACKRAGLELLEPLMSVEVTAPEEHIGTVTGSLCAKRGKIVKMETKGKSCILEALVPLGGMFGYSSELRSMTSGRGEFTMHFEHYEAMPYALAEEIVEKRLKEREK
ncbi:MAG: elongation factor G, partial [Candidatus Aureabacteria bacterium]|nr:elongation factor G [Candidatus Auribacterota bacterium]